MIERIGKERGRRDHPRVEVLMVLGSRALSPDSSKRCMQPRSMQSSLHAVRKPCTQALFARKASREAAAGGLMMLHKLHPGPER